MYENKRQPLASKDVFYARLWKNAGVAFTLLMICLLACIAGYKITVPAFDWSDGLRNAPLILGGMGQRLPPASYDRKERKYLLLIRTF